MTDRVKKFILLAGDFSLLWLSLFLALAIRQREFASASALILQNLAVFTGLFIVWLIVFTVVNLYDLRELHNNLQFFTLLGKALFTNALVSTGFFYFAPHLAITPKIVLVLLVGIAFVLTFLWRQLFNRIAAASFLGKKSIVVGWDAATLELVNVLETKPQLGYHVVALLKMERHMNPPLQGGLVRKELTLPIETLAEYGKEKGAQTLIVSPEAYADPGFAATLQECLALGMQCVNVSALFEQTLKRVPLSLVNLMWFLDHLGEGRRRAYAALKRLADVVIALALGMVFFIPGLAITFAVKWDSAGPVFYRQRRLGKSGKPFWLFKFRSMLANDPFGGAEALTGVRFTEERDSRVTRVGRFIRRSHLDELGQLWNIFKGEMSLVGPRPERPEFYESWRTLIPFFDHRLIVTPGVTGWAQLHYTYANTPEAAEKNLQHDLYYIKHRSFFFDLGIVLKTVRILLRGGGR